MKRASRHCRILRADGPLHGTRFALEASDPDLRQLAEDMPRRAAVSLPGRRTKDSRHVLTVFDSETGPVPDDVIAVLALDEGEEAEQEATLIARSMQRLMDRM